MEGKAAAQLLEQVHVLVTLNSGRLSSTSPARQREGDSVYSAGGRRLAEGDSHGEIGSLAFSLQEAPLH